MCKVYNGLYDVECSSQSLQSHEIHVYLSSLVNVFYVLHCSIYLHTKLFWSYNAS